MRQLICYFDGCCEPRNPGGNMGTGSCIYAVAGNSIKKEDLIFEHSDFYPAKNSNSNNVAEYLAFRSILTWLQSNFNSLEYSNTVQIWSDSKLVIMQMLGEWKMKGGYYVPVAMDCIKLLKELKASGLNFMIAWHGRNENAFADRLSKAMLLKNNVEFKLQPNP